MSGINKVIAVRNFMQQRETVQSARWRHVHESVFWPGLLFYTCAVQSPADSHPLHLYLTKLSTSILPVYLYSAWSRAGMGGEVQQCLLGVPATSAVKREASSAFISLISCFQTQAGRSHRPRHISVLPQKSS